MKFKPFVFLILIFAVLGLAWTNPPRLDATATPTEVPKTGNTRLAPDLTAVQAYDTPTPEGALDPRLRKTQMWCERHADQDLTYEQRLHCGLTPQPYLRSWDKKTQVWLEGCRWSGLPQQTACPVFPLATTNPYKYTVTPEPLS
jgi:hypothetical protein